MSDPNPAEQAVARKIRELRQAAGWSQGQMAQRMTAAGHSWYPQTVGRVELQERHVRIGELVDLAAIFGINPALFFGALDIPSAAAMRIAIEREVRQEIAAEIAGRAA
jgi:transcriptional regulator with XRE-family HTH domain